MVADCSAAPPAPDGGRHVAGRGYRDWKCRESRSWSQRRIVGVGIGRPQAKTADFRAREIEHGRANKARAVRRG